MYLFVCSKVNVIYVSAVSNKPIQNQLLVLFVKSGAPHNFSKSSTPLALKSFRTNQYRLSYSNKPCVNLLSSIVSLRLMRKTCCSSSVTPSSPSTVRRDWYRKHVLHSTLMASVRRDLISLSSTNAICKQVNGVLLQFALSFESNNVN